MRNQLKYSRHHSTFFCSPVLFAVIHFITYLESIFFYKGGGGISCVGNLKPSLIILIITETFSDIQRTLLSNEAD